MSKKVTIGYKPGRKLGQQGKTVVEADGFNGSGCEQATQKYRDALGKEVSNTHKPEYDTESFDTQAEQEKQFE